MEKLFEKKNLGIPVTLLVLLSYLIGYFIYVDFGGLLVAVLFAVVVFALDFDDKVKTALKQSYIVGILFTIIDFLLSVLYKLSEILNPSGYGNFLSRLVSTVYRYGTLLVGVAAALVFALFLVVTLLKKDLKIDFLLNLLGEGAPKQKQQAAPVFNQMPPQSMQQPIPPMQPMYQQPVMPQQPVAAPVPPQPVSSDVICPSCNAVNKQGAAFCGSCGTKLQ